MNFNDSAPSESFNNFCLKFQNLSSRKHIFEELQDFRVILHLIMRKCYKDDILAGRIWILKHCNTLVKADLAIKYILSLAKGRRRVEDRLHLLYLISDVLFHASKKNMTCLKSMILSIVVPLLTSIHSEEDESGRFDGKVIEVIDFWSEKNIFEEDVLIQLRHTH